MAERQRQSLRGLDRSDRQDGEIDVVLSKALRVLGHAELCQSATCCIAAAPWNYCRAPRLDVVESIRTKVCIVNAFGRPVSQFGVSDLLIMSWHFPFLCPNSRPINVSQQITFRAISRHRDV